VESGWSIDIIDDGRQVIFTIATTVWAAVILALSPLLTFEFLSQGYNISVNNSQNQYSKSCKFW